MATKVDVDKNIQTVVDVIRRFGKPNSSFPQDLDLDYATISKETKFGGLGTILKNMRKQKILDFADQGMLKDSSIITLIHDYSADSVTTQITYDQIQEKIKGEATSHQKIIQ